MDILVTSKFFIIITIFIATNTKIMILIRFLILKCASIINRKGSSTYFFFATPMVAQHKKKSKGPGNQGSRSAFLVSLLLPNSCPKRGYHKRGYHKRGSPSLPLLRSSILKKKKVASLPSHTSHASQWIHDVEELHRP